MAGRVDSTASAVACLPVLGDQSSCGFVNTDVQCLDERGRTSMALQTAMVLEAAAALQFHPSAAFTLAKVSRVRPSVPQPVLRCPMRRQRAAGACRESTAVRDRKQPGETCSSKPESAAVVSA